jgi:hypothetical protein
MEFGSPRQNEDRWMWNLVQDTIRKSKCVTRISLEILRVTRDGNAALQNNEDYMKGANASMCIRFEKWYLEQQK